MNFSSVSTRRRFLAQTAAATGALYVPTALGQTNVSEQSDTAFVRVLLHEADGQPLDRERAKRLHARDLANDPLPQKVHMAEGRARIELAPEPLQLSCQINVPNFGEVYCYADNEGRGYAQPGNVEFVVEAAKTRLRRVREYFEQVRHSIASDPQVETHLQAAARPIPKKPGAEQIAAAYESLAHGLHAGELLALLAARARIARMPQPRKHFLFGGSSSSWARGGDYDKYFRQLFNFAVTSWYSWKNPEPESERIDYTRYDESLNWCLQHNITPKGFGYCYMTRGATPEWFRSWPFEKVLPEYKRIVRQTMRRYDGRVPYVEVINEAHDSANLFRLSHKQIVETTREVLRSAREGSPTVKRLINNCCLWAEHAVKRNDDGSRRWSAYRYLNDCISNGCEFEVIGLQLYYPRQDVFETERMLDRFKALGKPLHISEISCNSAPGLDPASMRPKDLVPGWHGPWTETMQADWLESIYTICYSKAEFEAVGFWDFADYGGHFWPFGALLHKDYTPKESYWRLLNLQKSWGLKA
jgi:endo-1,4-beta-xylanase